MDINDKLNTLPDAVRRQILQAICQAPTHQQRTAADFGDAGKEQGNKLQSRNDGLLCPRHAACLREVKLVSGACIVDGFLPAANLQAVLGCAKEALAEDNQQAAIGGAVPLSSASRLVDAQARGDMMRWLHPEREVQAGRAPLADLLHRLDALRQQLTRQGYDIVGRPTYQLACYPGGGARYVRHADASISCPTRSLTAIVYLNEPDWDARADGGCLALYNVPYSGPLAGRGLEAGEPATLVAPLGGRLVVFESHLFHEVLPAHRHRYAVTAWFHRRAPESADDSSTASEPPKPSCAQAQGGGPSLDQQENTRPTPEALWSPAAGAAPGAGPSHAEGEAEAGTGRSAGTCTATAPAAKASGPADFLAALLPTTTPQATAPANASPWSPASPPTLLPAPPSLEPSVGSLPSPTAAPTPQEDTMPRGHPSAAVQQGACGACIGAGGPPPPRIFVSVAAYRDPECQWTLHSLFSRADRPDRVRVGVVWQVHPVEDAALIRVAGARAHPEWLQQVRQIVLPHIEATGPCKARALAQGLWEGEEYVLQIDSHMRMVSGWDTKCINQLAAAEARCTTGKAVLSSYPLGYSGDGAAASTPDEDAVPVTLLCARGFGEDGFLRTTGRVLRARPAEPLPSSFWAAGLSFARSQWMQEVPYCPHLPHLFFGEEPFMLARMWTRGWDVFAPAVPLAFHQWERAAREHTYQRDTGPTAGKPTGTASATGAAGANATTIDEAAAATGAAAADGCTHAAAARNPLSGGANGLVEGSTCPGFSPAEARRRSQRRVLAVLGVTDDMRVGCGVLESAAASSSSGMLAAARVDTYGDSRSEQAWGVGQVWGLGTCRTLDQLTEATGVAYGRREVSVRALWGGMPEDAFV